MPLFIGLIVALGAGLAGGVATAFILSLHTTWITVLFLLVFALWLKRPVKI